jgi:hypothetical protein
MPPSFHWVANTQPGATGWKPGAGSLLQNDLLPLNFVEVFRLFGCGRMWKTKVGQLPTELIEFTPLNSAEFLLLKEGNKAKKELQPLQIK